MLPAGKDVVAFQCRNPIHRAHYELFTRALDAENVGEGAACLVHPTMGPTQDDDISGLVRYHTYEVLAKEVNNPAIRWAYLPYSMHMAGPREAIQHMIIRKNYGCTHFIIGRDMAGSKSSIDGEDFYGAYDAQDLAKANAAELGMKTVPSSTLCTPTRRVTSPRTSPRRRSSASRSSPAPSSARCSAAARTSPSGSRSSPSSRFSASTSKR